MDLNHRAYRTSGVTARVIMEAIRGLHFFAIRIENKHHPITAGVEDYVFNAEQGGRNVQTAR
jgi:hypothetical protein